MKKMWLLWILATMLAAPLIVGAPVNNLPEYFKGQILAEGKMPAWLPDGKGISYIFGDKIYIYDLASGKARSLAKMNIAEYQWINPDSAVVIEWPSNAADTSQVTKIINYWIIHNSGKRSLLGSDTLITNSVPDYKHIFQLPDETFFIRKGAGWKKTNLPQTDQYLAFAPIEYNLAESLKKYRYLSYSDQENGSLLFKDINRTTVKTLTLGRLYTNLQLSPDYTKTLVMSKQKAIVIDSSGNLLADLGEYIDTVPMPGFKKFFDGVWNHGSTGIVYFEICDQSGELIRLNYFDLAAKKKTTLTRTDYYRRDGLQFAPDDSAVVTWVTSGGKDYIALINILK